MQFLRSNVNEYLLSPVERKQRQDLMTAITTLEAAVKELHIRSEDNQPNLRSRELIHNSDKAIGVLKSFMERRVDAHRQPLAENLR
jgi:hypothetical protein